MKQQRLPAVEFKKESIDDILSFVAYSSHNEAIAADRGAWPYLSIVQVPPTSFHQRFAALVAEEAKKPAAAPKPKVEKPTEDFFGGWSTEPSDNPRDRVVKKMREEVAVHSLEWGVQSLGTTLDLLRAQSDTRDQTITRSGLVLWHEKGHVLAPIQVAETSIATNTLKGLEQVLIPEINFRDATLFDVISFLSSTGCESKRDPSMVIPRVIVDGRDGYRNCSIAVRVCSLADAYRWVALVTGCRCVILPNGTILFSSARDSLAPLKLRDPEGLFQDVVIPEVHFFEADVGKVTEFLNDVVLDFFEKPIKIKASPVDADKLCLVSLSIQRVQLSEVLQIIQNLDGVAFAVEPREIAKVKP